MKKLSICLSVLMGVVLLSCSEDEKPIDEVFATVTNGAVLRTQSTSTTSLNLLDQSSLFSLTIEEQDAEGGALLGEVNVFVGLQDASEDNGFTPPSEALIRNVQASEFGTSSFGLPETTISFTFGEALAAMGLSQADTFGGDFVVVRLELVLTDGRTFTSNQASGTISQSFFASPFQYPLLLICEVETPFTGDYVIEMVDNYGDGWQGSQVVATIDGVDYPQFLPDFWGPTNVGGSPGDPAYTNGTAVVNVPDGSSSLEFSYVAGQFPSEVEFEIFGPSGNTITGPIGPSPAEGPIAVNLCRESN